MQGQPARGMPLHPGIRSASRFSACPTIDLSKVDFPAPFGPTSAIRDPIGTVRRTLSSVQPVTPGITIRDCGSTTAASPGTDSPVTWLAAIGQRHHRVKPPIRPARSQSSSVRSVPDRCRLQPARPRAEGVGIQRWGKVDLASLGDLVHQIRVLDVLGKDRRVRRWP